MKLELPIVTPALIVKQYAETFVAMFENRCQFEHFENYLTGLIALPNKSMTNITRCILDSADKTNLSRFFSESTWKEQTVNEARVKLMIERTRPLCGSQGIKTLNLDDTLCEHMGNLF